MNIDRNIHFIKLWKKIEKDQQDIDFRKSEWSRDLRKNCANDAEFVAWCDVELGMARNTADELLRRARLISVVVDASTWNRLGGYEKLQPLLMMSLPRKEQIAIIEAAKIANYRSILPIMKQRGHAPSPRPPSPRSTERLPVVATPTAIDIKRLAEFIDETYKNPPADIRRIIKKYIASVAANAAANATENVDENVDPSDVRAAR